MKHTEAIQFFSTGNFPCSYLPGRIARNCVIDPAFDMDDAVYSNLLKSGFRRSGQQVYRPLCLPCTECTSTRIPVDLFKPSRSQKRNIKTNQDLTVKVNTTGYKQEYQPLYDQYLRYRHDNTQSEGVEDFFGSGWCNTHYIEFYEKNELIGVAVIDVLNTEISAVYTFFEPEKGSKRSLGTYAVLWQIEYAKNLGKSYVYPGYWIKECSKMNYKSNFQPIEGYNDGRWLAIEKQF
ncbi:MAG: arginyltransferase [Thiotrichaceae bacterium]